MRRQVLIALLLLAVGAYGVPAQAQEWARKMFTDTTHDFGSVARGAKVQYRFKFNNPYVEPAHVLSVRSSCGCTEASVTKPDLKTWETSEVVANFNTNAFFGVHSATITVTFDKPYIGEVQLQVNGNILTDVVMQPGAVDLGTVDAGQGVEKKLTLTHTGRSDWAITDVRSANTNFEVEVIENHRTTSSVVYDLLVRLKPSSPPGYIDDQLFLMTNDSEAPQLPLDVTGRVVAEVSVSPTSLALGTLAPGQSVTKNVVIRSKRPFKVLGVECNDDLSCKLPEDSHEVQLIPVTFTAPQQLGKIVQKLKIKTDLGDNAVPEISCQATVVEGAGSPTPTSGSSTSSAYRYNGARTAGYLGQ